MQTATLKYTKLAALIVWMALIFYLSNKPGLSSGSTYDLYLRKGAHIFEYGVLAALVYANLKAFFARMNFRAMFIVAALISIAYSITDEIHQHFVPDRNGTPKDVLVDAVGILLAVLLMKFWPRLVLRKNKNHER